MKNLTKNTNRHKKEWHSPLKTRKKKLNETKWVKLAKNKNKMKVFSTKKKKQEQTSHIYGNKMKQKYIYFFLPKKSKKSNK